MALYRAHRHGAGSVEQARATLRAAERAVASKAGWDDLDLAIKADDAGRLRALIDAGVSPNARASFGSFPLYQAAFEGRAALVDLLLTLGADLEQANFEGATALFGAAFRGHAEVVELLLAKGARADRRNQFKQLPSDRAARGGHAALARRLAQAAGGTG